MKNLLTLKYQIKISTYFDQMYISKKLHVIQVFFKETFHIHQVDAISNGKERREGEERFKRICGNKREMYGRKDLICSCRVCFRFGRWSREWEGMVDEAKLIFISVQKGLQGGVNLHVSFATDPGYRGDNGQELKYYPGQVLTLLRCSRYAYGYTMVQVPATV